MSGVLRDQAGQPILDHAGQPITDQTWTPGPDPGPQRPGRPSVVSAVVVGDTLLLTGSAYYHPEGRPHTASQWQVQAAGGGWSAPLYDSGETSADLTAHEVNISAWGAGIYEARVRYSDNQP